MYSLYRAWFGGEESHSQLESVTPPDTLVRVGNEGEYHFVAHRTVLAAHSGYLKALLTDNTTDVIDGSSSLSGTQPLVTTVIVPSTIGGEAFAPLLHYMYTGRLEVNLDNIYTVLLATHLLNMPGALVQCRAALLQLRAASVVSASTSSTPPSVSSSIPLPPPLVVRPLQQQQQQSSCILRPVPNRLLRPTFCWPSSSVTANHLYSIRHLELAHLPTTVAILPSSPRLPKTSLPYGKEPSISPSSASSQMQQHSTDKTSVSPELEIAASTTSMDQFSKELQQITPVSSPSNNNKRILRNDVNNKQQQQTQQSTRIYRAYLSRSERESNQQERSLSFSVTGSEVMQTPGVVYDVACCDGPVRFHRVLNKNYIPTTNQALSIEDQRGHDDHRHHHYYHQQFQLYDQHQAFLIQCNGKTSSSRQVEESPVLNRENNENEHRQSQNHPSSENGHIADDRLNSYTCLYCQHTFKSQYCYRKHTRRHLLPTDAENASNDQHLQQVQTQPEQRIQHQNPLIVHSETKKREVRLLDLNVQYYPCKICGSKFPSYYFVHKHRKLCHANTNVEETQRHFSGNDDRRPIKSGNSALIQQQHQ